MTCIVALTNGQTVYMGGDSAAVDEHNGFITTRKEPKVFIRGEYIIGYAGSFRFGKVVEHSFNVPDPIYTDINKFMNTEFVSALRECADDSRLDLSSDDKDMGELLIGVHGKIFELNGDWHIGEDSNDFNCIGSGSSYALGSLFSTGKMKNQRARIEIALKAAENFSAYVKRPFTILER